MLSSSLALLLLLLSKCKGDLHVDDHHTAEDCALALGKAFDTALGPRMCISRFGMAMCPLDEVTLNNIT